MIPPGSSSNAPAAQRPVRQAACAGGTPQLLEGHGPVDWKRKLAAIRGPWKPFISRNGPDLLPHDSDFGVIGLLEIILALQADEQITGYPETELESQGHPRADPFFLADHIAELGFADVHGLRGLDLGDAVMDEGVPDEGGCGV